MLTETGSYRDWAVILPRSLAAADATGERVESWPDPPADATPHAGRIEAPGGSESGPAAPPRQSGKGLRLRLLCYAVLAATDHVRLVATGEVYAVGGSWAERRADGRGWQTVCDLSGPV